MGLLVRLLILGIVVGSFGFIIYQIANFFLAINSGKSKQRKDKKQLLDQLDKDYLDDLVALDQKEFELLSLNFEQKTTNDAFGTITTGYYSSIYDEPLIAFGTKDYFTGDQYLAVAKTKNDQYSFEYSDGKTQAFKNGKALGIIDSSGKWTKPDQKEIARIDLDPNAEFHLISANNKELVHLKNSKNLESGNHRAFPIVDELDDVDKDIVLTMTLFDILT